MSLVKQFHSNNSRSNSYSLFKEATKYATEFGFTLDLNNSQIVIRHNHDDDIFQSNDYYSNFEGT